MSGYSPEEYVAPPDPPSGSPMPKTKPPSWLQERWICPECKMVQTTMYADTSSNLLDLNNHLLVHLIQRGRNT